MKDMCALNSGRRQLSSLVPLGVSCELAGNEAGPGQFYTDGSQYKCVQARSATATSSSSLETSGMSPPAASRSSRNSPKPPTPPSSPGPLEKAVSPPAAANKTAETPTPPEAKASSSATEEFSLIETASFMDQLPPYIFGLSDWEDTDILARVLAQSQQEYLDSLRRSSDSGSSSSAGASGSSSSS